jgi:hypothetical protein
MIEDIKISGSGARALKSLSKDFPRETYRGIGRAGASVRAKLRKVMRSGGGVEDVPKFSPLAEETIVLKRISRRKKSRINKPGGVLTKASSIQMFNKRRGGFTVGFISALEPYARTFQEQEFRVLTDGEKRFYRIHDLLTSTYSRPARVVLKPFTRAVEKDLVAWAIRATEKLIEKKSK